ncbi:hypothetical protein [Gluconobacter albidus]|uniref:Uncharacterized protein n=1 Tax=Gluconobacter albidus TaxID=318683 RepID=A0AAW3QZZ1_9PROT|nr:hypothetical protein [Gluconobacter albidus]KXV42469.1 hypothetical protein AD941_00730 [Gluconobacter albidus]GBQ91161.1 hypothetical protein AA3250_2218 [Gluconobacter albidus NBRC 3250]GLQ68074.1 hypothetical protein GCM10007866_05220 [Gluconobacter albidus]
MILNIIVKQKGNKEMPYIIQPQYIGTIAGLDRYITEEQILRTKFFYILSNNNSDYADDLYLNHFRHFPIDDRITILKYVSHNNLSNETINALWMIRKVVAIYGTEQDRWDLIDDESANVRSAIATYGTEAQREYLKDDKSKQVRSAIYKMAETDELRDHVFNGKKIYPSMIKSVLSSDTKNKKHIAKCKLLDKRK